MKYRPTVSGVLSFALLAAIGTLFLFLYSIDGDIVKWMHHQRAAERMQMVGEFDRLNPPRIEPAPAYGKGWFIINKDSVCPNLDVEKVMTQMAAASYHDQDIMDTYAMCAELGFRPVLRHEPLPPVEVSLPSTQ